MAVAEDVLLFKINFYTILRIFTNISVGHPVCQDTTGRLEGIRHLKLLRFFEKYPMRKIIFTLLFFTISLSVFAQTTKFSVTGSLKDTDDAPISGATVVLLQAKDSILYKFAVSNATGDFLIKKVLPGDYILQATYIGFKMVNQPIKVEEDKAVGTILMEVKAEDVGTVTVEADRVPLEIKNDTLVYNADAYKVRPDAVVEDLLKRLPGVEVESDGTVKAQGEEVKKVYVDGKEFFGDDPQTATKNLPADAIDQIEVFDERSDMSQFTGVDDGTRDKAINLTLKKDRKKGYFGTIEAGGGTENRYMSKANVNHFNQKLQASVLGMYNNINEQGFSIRDYASFMGGFQNIMRGGSGRINSNDLGLPISNDIGDGFTTTGATGLNMNYEFKKDNNLNLSYFYTDIHRDIEQVINRENFFGTETSYYNQNDEQTSIFRNHNIRSTYRNQFDEKNRLIWNGSLGFNTANYNTDNFSQTNNSENIEINSGYINYVSDKNTITYNTNATYAHRMEKLGRSIGLSAAINNTKNSQDALLNSINSYNIRGTGDVQIDSILQDQLQASTNLNYSANLTFTEPLGKRRYLTLTYDNRNYSENLDKDFFDIEGTTQTLNDLLSTEYEKDYVYHKTGIGIRKVTDKSNLSIQLEGQLAELTGDLITLDTTINISIVRPLPSLSWRYTIGTGQSLSLNYRTAVNEPDIEELQPILDNSDPLNLYIGNPNLKPEYQHRLSLRYNHFDQFTFTSFFANVTGTYTKDKITTARTVDTLFRQISTPVNVQNDMSLRGFASFSTPIRAIGARIRLNTNATVQRGYIFISDVENIQNRKNISGRAILENRNKDVFDISGGGRWTLSNTTYSVNTAQNQTFLTQNYFADLTVYIGENWYANTAFNYTIYDGGTLENRQEVPIWQASLTRYVLKNQRGQLRFTAMDILNRNVGINWESDLNYIQESTITSLGRYFMLSFRYQIRNVGGKAKKTKSE